MSFEETDLPEEEINDIENEEQELSEETAPTGRFERLLGDGGKKYKLSGMFREWYIDYSSYTVLYRAVPHLIDGLKPVQRRVLHAMWRMDDGSYTKVANIVGQAMQFHPHGDQSILGALVWLGQRNYLVDCQGNWGNILTGDSNAAPRYIEARLSKFGKEVVFNPKTTNWMTSYDGRNQEPIELPVKFPILLAQGTEGIGAGFASKILPHNFNELIDASISILQGKDFEIFPDFLTGGSADCSKYSSKKKGGKIKVRAKIEKIDKNTLAITEIPFSKTTDAVKESIVEAKESGKMIAYFQQSRLAPYFKKVKEVLDSGLVRREELFITSKVWNDMHGKGDVLLSLAKTLKDLRLDYIDAYFVHWPFPNYHAPGCDGDARNPNSVPFSVDEFMATWRQMERLHDMGLARNIGMSSMTIPKLEAVLPLCRIKPTLIEMELHPSFQQPELYDYCVQRGIQPIAFCIRK